MQQNGPDHAPIAVERWAVDLGLGAVDWWEAGILVSGTAERRRGLVRRVGESHVPEPAGPLHRFRHGSESAGFSRPSFDPSQSFFQHGWPEKHVTWAAASMWRMAHVAVQG